jgi:hypothetical protein
MGWYNITINLTWMRCECALVYAMARHYPVNRCYLTRWCYGAIAAFAAEGIVDPKSADPMCASATPSSATLASTTYHKGKELHHSLCYGCLHPFETQSYVANHTCQGTESVKNVLGSDEVC